MHNWLMQAWQFVVSFWGHWYGKVSSVATSVTAVIGWFWTIRKKRADALKSEQEQREFKSGAPAREFEIDVQNTMQRMRAEGKAHIDGVSEAVNQEAFRRIAGISPTSRWRG
jgi:hypothetical protein